MELTVKQLQAIKLYVYDNCTGKQVAETVGVTENTVSNWNKKEEFLEELDKEIKRKFKKMALKAQNKLEELIDNANGNVALGAVKETLSKAGFDATVKQEILETTISVSVDD